MWFVVAFLSSELDVIVEFSTMSLVIQTFEFVIVVLSIVVPLSSEPVEVVFVTTLLLYIVEVVRSEFVIVESFTSVVVEFELVSLDTYMLLSVSTMASVKFVLFSTELCTWLVSSIEYLSVAFWIVEASNMFEYCIVEWL